MSTANRDTTNKKWKISADLGTVTSADISKTLTLATAGTYVDQDIEVTMTAETPGAATLGASATGSATISSAIVGTKASGAYPITGSADITGTASASTTKSGFATKDTTTGTGSTTGTATLNASITAAAATVSGAATVKPNALTAANGNAKIADSATTTQPTSGYYVAATPATAATTSITQTKTLTTAGYLGATSEITASGSVTGGNGSKYYIPIKSASLDNKATTDVTYTENTSIIIPSQGALYINEGYTPAIKITLDQMLDGKTDTAGTADSDIRTGKVAYDVDGKKLTGTMGNATVTNGAVTHSLAAPSYNADTGLFDQTCKIAVAAPSVTSAGYISSTEGTKTATAEATENHSLAKIAGSTAITGTTTKQPTIAKQDFTITGVTNAASGAATTTAPTSGVYVKVKSAASTGTLTATPSITTAGYGTADYNGITGNTATVGASASADTYVPIKTTSAKAKTAPTPSATSSNVTLGTASPTAPESGYYIKADASAGATTVAAAGWISAGDTSTGAGTSKYYAINTAALTHDNTATETQVAVSVSGSATGVKTQTAASSYYITVSGSQTAAGSVKHTASVSEGYVPTAGLSAEATIPTSAAISGSGDKIYLQASKITGSMTNSVTGTGYTNPTLPTTAPTSGPYLTLTGNGSATSGAVYNGTATAANKYMAIYAGSYTLS